MGLKSEIRLLQLCTINTSVSSWIIEFCRGESCKSLSTLKLELFFMCYYYSFFCTLREDEREKKESLYKE